MCFKNGKQTNKMLYEFIVVNVVIVDHFNLKNRKI